MTLTRQLEELQLLQCSLLPGELLTFLDNVEKARFQVKLDNAHVWFEAELPRLYPSVWPVISVKGDIARDEQARWQGTVKEKMQELHGSEYLLYELFSDHLLPLLHAEYDATVALTAEAHTSSSSVIPIHYHALLTSHHLISPQKRRSLQQWSDDLCILGFAKVGYPGIIYAEGTQTNIEEFVSNVKAMQWLALRVRFVEAIEGAAMRTDENHWVEFQKVGEVVEEMKRIGREEFILEMGIGSGSAGPK